MIDSIGNSRKRIFAFNSKSISNLLKKIITLLPKSQGKGSFHAYPRLPADKRRANWPKLKSFTESRWFNFYGTLVLVLFVLVFKGTGDDQASLFSNFLRKYVEETSASVVTISQSQNQLADINSLVALNNQDNQNFGQGGPADTLDPSTVQDNSLIASNPTLADYINSFKPDQVIEYTVQSGDSIGIIASDFGVSVDTVIWANNLRNPNTLSIGQILKIPPVTGIIHTVRQGDTIASIAKKYKADPQKILSFNQLQDDKSLISGNEIIVPGGQLAGPKPSVKYAMGSGGSGIYVPVGNGQCVVFVQAHNYANYHGNAYQWAKYINTPVPVAGGVVVFRGGRWGHIAIITAVKENSFQVVEQNFYGLYVIDHREISLADRAIVGFIQ